MPEPSAPYVLEDLTIDYAERRVSLAGSPVEMTDIEYRTLAELSSHAGRVLTYEHLLRRVWRLEPDADLRPMRTVIRRLRRKLGGDAEDPTYIFTELRVGYRMPKGKRGRGRDRAPLTYRATEAGDHMAPMRGCSTKTDSSQAAYEGGRSWTTGSAKTCSTRAQRCLKKAGS